MNTQFALMARFESPTVHLKEICEEFFGIKPKTAEQKAKAQSLPVPAFKLIDSERAPTLVNVSDLAKHIDTQRELAAKDWELIQQASQ